MPPQHPHTPQPHERGQSLAEYAILLAGIAVVVGVTIPLLGTAVSGLFSTFVKAVGG
jgi:Flp pilus assembly pilin Flp